MNDFTCPVCGYDALEFPPRDYSICACCGTEFGYDDRVLSHEQLRLEWINQGYPWFDPEEPKPADWSGPKQLFAAGLAFHEAAFGVTNETFGDDLLKLLEPFSLRDRLKEDESVLQLNWV